MNWAQLQPHTSKENILEKCLEWLTAKQAYLASSVIFLQILFCWNNENTSLKQIEKKTGYEQKGDT